MKLHFTIEYYTQWGESVCLSAETPLLGNGDESKAINMTTDDGRRWTLSVDLPDGVLPFSYRYLICKDNNIVRREWGHPRLFNPAPGVNVYDIFDHWQAQPDDAPFYSSAFVNCINRHNSGAMPLQPCIGEVTLSVSAPTLAPNRHIALVGDNETLGQWNPRKALPMDCNDFPIWKINIPADAIDESTEYKFIIVDKQTGELVSWEGGNNRKFGVTPNLDTATILSGLLFNSQMPLWYGAGTAIPVFSLRTDDDFGVGDFYDLIKFVDWGAATGQTFIQLLPINDTTIQHTWMDSYPYNANSTFALHPMYLRLSELGTIKNPKRREYYEKQRKELNTLTKVDYERVNKVKMEYIHDIFDHEGHTVLASKEYADFEKANSHWLMQYAAFCALRDRFGTPDFRQWGEYAVFSEYVLAKAISENRDTIRFNCYVQYNLDKQMRAVHDYANSHGVALKGDIPIGISHDSVDAWVNPNLFYMDCQAGAPPDDFSVLGQNWGFPTYNWEEMSKDGFAWWKARFRKMAEYFDAYRIDHVLGFFRIWQIPMDAIHGLLGVFNPALPFTPKELLESYDFHIDTDLHTSPFIMDYFLEKFFGEHTAEVREKYLEATGFGRYRLRDFVSTQRKIANYFAEQPSNDKNNSIAQALMLLVDEVLFIEDFEQKGKYHPRISAQSTHIYGSLSEHQRQCFDRLYNDFYYRRHNQFWYDKAMRKLPMLTGCTDMLVCAEDLGMIPDCVPAVINELKIVALEIQRMPKTMGVEFGDTWHYPYYSVCTSSTHDMSSIRGWWEEDLAKSQRFFNTVLNEESKCPTTAEPWICERIVDLHLKSSSMLCILPLADWLSTDGNIRRANPTDERINIPANSRHYWCYRMHLTIEELAAHTEFNKHLLTKIKAACR